MLLKLLNKWFRPTLYVKVDIRSFYNSMPRADKDLLKDGTLDLIVDNIRTQIIRKYKEYEYDNFPDKAVK